jgi:APA family basic amino acid/polyamine antiporter
VTAGPRRQLGFAVTAAIVVANMIGTGVFTFTGYQAASLHDPGTIVLAWIIGGIAALCGAACYAELGSIMPKAGGEYVYLREAYHPMFGVLSGWVSLTAGFSAPIAAAAIAFAKYVSAIVGTGLVSGGGSSVEGLGDPAQKAIAIALILAVTALHSFDTKIGGRVQALFTALKVALIVIFVGAGLVVGQGDWSHFATQSGGLANVATKDFAIALMYVSFAYSGWNAAAYIAGDVQNPERNLPRALLVGTGTVMALYVLLNVVYFYALSSPRLENVGEVGAVTAVALFGNAAGTLIASLIALALVSTVSAMVMAGPRVYASMAADGALPRPLAWHSVRGVPSVAVVAQGGLAVLFVVVATLPQLVEFVGFALAASAALTVASLFVMRRRGAISAYRAWGYPVTPVLFIALSLWIVYSQVAAHPRASAIVAGVMAVIALAYIVRGRISSVASARR